jgi:hypothetical protein
MARTSTAGDKHLHHYLAEFDFRHSNRSSTEANDGDSAAIS